VAARQAAWPTLQMDARRALALALGEQAPRSGVIPALAQASVSPCISTSPHAESGVSSMLSPRTGAMVG
jgi:hypothetical protein